YEWNPHERGCRDARRQPEYAPQLGAPLRLPPATALARRAQELCTRRDRGAEEHAGGNSQRLLGDLAGQGTRRRTVVRRTPRACLRRLRRAAGRSAAGGEPCAALVRADDRGDLASRGAGTRKQGARERGVRVQLALRDRMAVRAQAPRAAG